MKFLSNLAAALAIFGLVLNSGALVSPKSAYVRINQVGYINQETKTALLMTSDPEKDATFTIKTTSGKTVFGPARIGPNLGAWNNTFPYIYELDFSALQTTGTYTLQVKGPIAATSPKFGINSGANLYTKLVNDTVLFLQAQRDGPNVISSVLKRKPSHLTDKSASIYTPPTYVVDSDGNDILTGDLTKIGGPIDVSGGWFDAGDYLKFVHNMSYADAALLFAIRDYPVVNSKVFQDEARFGLDWLQKMWDDNTRTLYYQVGIGDGNGTTILGDHDFWRLPQKDDELATKPGDPDYYVKYRPVFRAGNPGGSISPNLAGRLTAALALCYQVYSKSYLAYADKCLTSAEHIYDLADTNPVSLVTAEPADYYPESEWKSDMEWGAVELALALANQNGTLPQGLPHTDPGYYLLQSAHWAHAYITDTDTHGQDTLNLYDVSALAHYEVYRAIDQVGDPSILEVTKSDLIDDLKFQLDLGVENASQDPFGLGFAYAQFDVDSHTLGLATTAYLYKNLTGSTDYDTFAQNQRDWILGRNAWGSTFIVGAGTTFPFCLQHQVANLSGSLSGGSPILLGAVVNGPNSVDEFTDISDVGIKCPANGKDPFSKFTGKDTRYMDDVRTWQSSEPALDMSALSPIMFAEQFSPASHCYYVSISGDDANPGTFASPWRHIQYALNQVGAGSTVYVLDGVYNEKVTFPNSGSAVGGYIVLQNYHGEAPVIDGTGLSISDTTALVTITNKQYVKLIGFEIRNLKAGGDSSATPIGIYVSGSGASIEIRNNKVHDIENSCSECGAHGIAAYGSNSTASIHDIIIDGNEVYNGKFGWSESMVLNGNVEFFTVSNNIVHDNDNIGIDLIGYERTASDSSVDRARDGTVIGNLVYNIDSYDNPAYDGDRSADGIYVDGGTRILIERNIIHDSDIGVELASEHKNRDTSYITLRNNFIYSNLEVGIAIGGYDTKRGSTQYCTIVNNTLYNNSSLNDWGSELYLQYNTRYNIIENNILFTNAYKLFILSWSPVMTANVVNYNLYFADGGGTDGTWQWKNVTYTIFSDYQKATGNDAHGIAGLDPLLVNPASGNLHIRSAGSPAVNAGKNLSSKQMGTTDIDGDLRISDGTVDIGADELVD